MTGLFHRLARLVVGPEAPRARSAASLPFAAPLGLEKRGVERREHAATAPGAEPALVVREADGPGRKSADPLALPPPLLADAEPPASGAAGHRLPAGDRPDDATAEQPRVVAADPATVGPRAEGRNRSGRAAGRNSAREDSGSGRTAPGAVAVDRAPQERRGTGTALPPEAVRAPEPLMPEDQAVGAPERPTQAPRGAARPAAHDPGQPEIHVHIGRIEVASVAEPQPKRPERQRQGAAAMSLEDYLARRRDQR